MQVILNSSIKRATVGLLLTFINCFLFIYPGFSQKKIALVIGNASYADAPLRNPVNDASDVASTLRRLGFSVTLKTNVNKRDMESAVRNFKSVLSKGDIALFYYSGHGMQVSGSNYLVPVGETILNETDIRYNAMEAQYVMDNMQDAGASVNIVILDACRDNPFKGVRSQSKGFIAVMAPQGTFIAYSTAPGSVASDGTSRNSPYTKNLISCITKPGVEIEDAFKEIRKNVMKETGNRQIPWESSSLIDNFSFTGPVTKNEMPVSEPNITSEKKLVQLGTLELTILMDGDLFVDGAFLKKVNSNTTLSLSNLSEGIHQLKIIGTETIEETAIIRPNQPTELTIENLKAFLASHIPEMIFVQGGTFQMGSENGRANEKPVHSVTLKDFYLGKFEVTQKFWRNVTGSDPQELFFKYCDECPVENVSWDDVQDFLQTLNTKTGKKYRLPTEAEWEFAAKGGNQSKGFYYSGSNNKNNIGWTAANSKEKTHPVGLKEPNELGFFDMTGNVNEWCSDFYAENYYTQSPAVNPQGPRNGTSHVLKGATYEAGASFSSTSMRFWDNPDTRDKHIGFRLCLSAE
jgi:formylglycine-generating enzyme required for sulfatase activity